MDVNKVNQYIRDFETLIENGEALDYEGELYTGVDLGTANIVLCVIDSKGRAVAGAIEQAGVVKDGVVVDYVGAIQIVRKLKNSLEDTLGTEVIKAAAAIPPGVEEGSVKAIVNVVEACDFEIVRIVDEPTAAAKVLEVKDGAVVDVGGGTTGISILKDGEVIFTVDEATGGHHMNLVVAGSYNLSYKEAEKLKHDSSRSDVYRVVQPVVEKMASIVKRNITDKDVSTIYVVGGACSFDEFEKTFEKWINIKTIKPYNPMLVTPLGIALSCLDEVK